MCYTGTNLNNSDECRNAVEMNERFIRRCTELWDRFAGLPACDDLIYNAVKDEFPQAYLASMDNYCYLPPPGEPAMNRLGDEFSGDMSQEGPEGGMSPEEGANPDFSRMPPEMQEVQKTLSQGRILSNSIYQLLFDWVNIYSAVVQGHDRREGLQVLTLLAMIQANLRSGLDNLAFEQPHMASALLERVLNLHRECARIIGEMLKKSAPLRQVFQSRYDGMTTLDAGFVSLLERSRRIAEDQSPF